MISDSEIEEKAAELKLHPQQVEKDYVHSWVLCAINSRPALKRLLVLKGGNALRKGYFPETRFSKDLDFSSIDHVEPDFLKSELREICRIVESQTAVKFMEDATRVEDKELPIPNVEALEARIYFKGFYNEENLTRDRRSAAVSAVLLRPGEIAVPGSARGRLSDHFLPNSSAISACPNRVKTAAVLSK